MENRLTKLISEMKDSTKSLLVPYMVAGFPTYEGSLEAFELFAEEGADIIEIGMPFSDPLADGAVIQLKLCWFLIWLRDTPRTKDP